MTRDSDFFCHRTVATVLDTKPDRHGITVVPVNKNAILTRLGINETVWRVLGIVSGNDDSNNNSSYGVNKNLKILIYAILK